MTETKEPLGLYYFFSGDYRDGLFHFFIDDQYGTRELSKENFWKWISITGKRILGDQNVER